MNLEELPYVSSEAALKLGGYPPLNASGNINLDSLTGLISKQFFLEELANYISFCQQAKRRFGLIYFNLNQFKTYNDMNSLICGDYLLIEIGKTVQAILSDSDIFCRCGGDCFVILAKTENKENILQLTANILYTIRQIPIKPFFFSRDQQKYFVFDSVSARASVAFFPEHFGDANNILSSLEHSAYLAKREGDSLRLLELKYSLINDL